jgi:hypothetical protein
VTAGEFNLQVEANVRARGETPEAVGAEEWALLLDCEGERLWEELETQGRVPTA